MVKRITEYCEKCPRGFNIMYRIYINSKVSNRHNQIPVGYICKNCKKVILD